VGTLRSFGPDYPVWDRGGVALAYHAGLIGDTIAPCGALSCWPWPCSEPRRVRPGLRWERSGGSETERRRVESECAARANRDRLVPAQRIMTGPGGRTSDTVELVTVRDFDSGAFDECMGTRGYQRVPPRPPA
jgi:hypothetical protein